MTGRIKNLFTPENVVYSLVYRNLQQVKFKTYSRALARDSDRHSPTSFIFESLRILAERLLDGRLTPAPDTNFLLTAYRGGSLPHLINTVPINVLIVRRQTSSGISKYILCHSRITSSLPDGGSPSSTFPAGRAWHPRDRFHDASGHWKNHFHIHFL